MSNLLKHVMPRESGLAVKLMVYPPYRAPFPGSGWELTEAQAKANLEYLVVHKGERLRILSGLLTPFGIDLGTALAAPDPKPFLDALWRWIGTEWPAIVRPNLTKLDTWLDSRRDGREIAFSLVMDVAIALAEMIIVRRPDYRWAIDTDPENTADTPEDAMVSWHRPVLLRPADKLAPKILLDVEEIVHGAYVTCAKPVYIFKNFLAQAVLNALSGKREGTWRATT